MEQDLRVRAMHAALVRATALSSDRGVCQFRRRGRAVLADGSARLFDIYYSIKSSVAGSPG